MNLGHLILAMLIVLSLTLGYMGGPGWYCLTGFFSLCLFVSIFGGIGKGNEQAPTHPTYNTQKARMLERQSHEYAIQEKRRKAEYEALKPITEKEVIVNNAPITDKEREWLRYG